jgi:DHA1 family tetracycline resistance protein-like MFS transporter
MTASTNRPKNALVFIFITLLIDIMGMAIIIPVIPKLIEELIQGDVNAASRYGGWLLFTFALLQFMCAPILGGLSDRYGRRPVLLIALLGMGIDYLVVCGSGPCRCSRCQLYYCQCFHSRCEYS